MTLPDLLISLREQFLDLVSSSNRTRTFNPAALLREDQGSGPGIDSTVSDPAAGLVHLLHGVLSSGLADGDGNADCTTLRNSPAYEDFCKCTWELRTFDPSTLVNRNAQLAFWINLYNTLVLNGVIAMKVQHSIMRPNAK